MAFKQIVQNFDLSPFEANFERCAFSKVLLSFYD